jgi:hypothetical protein
MRTVGRLRFLHSVPRVTESVRLDVRCAYLTESRLSNPFMSASSNPAFLLLEPRCVPYVNAHNFNQRKSQSQIVRPFRIRINVAIFSVLLSGIVRFL